MRNRLHIESLTVGLLSAFLAISTLPGIARAEEKGKNRIAVLTHSGGDEPGSLGLAEKIIKKIGQDSGAYEADCLEGYKIERAKVTLGFIDEKFLAKYDGLLFITTTGKREKYMLTDKQKSLLVDYYHEGGAYIGVHCACDSFYKWPEYGEIAGAYFLTHGPSKQPVTIKIEDKNHPATKMLGDEWVIADEFYQFRKEPYSRDKLHILMSIDTEKSDMKKQIRLTRGAHGDYALAWCREYGKGRSFYTALGHRNEVWENEKFQKHLLGGIQYALGLKDGDATPSNRLK